MYLLYQQAKLALDFINKLSLALGSVQIDRRQVYMPKKLCNFTCLCIDNLTLPIWKIKFARISLSCDCVKHQIDY